MGSVGWIGEDSCGWQMGHQQFALIASAQISGTPITADERNELVGDFMGSFFPKRI
jgi:hypothetical protein